MDNFGIFWEMGIWKFLPWKILLSQIIWYIGKWWEGCHALWEIWHLILRWCLIWLFHSNNTPLCGMLWKIHTKGGCASNFTAEDCGEICPESTCMKPSVCLWICLFIRLFAGGLLLLCIAMLYDSHVDLFFRKATLYHARQYSTTHSSSACKGLVEISIFDWNYTSQASIWYKMIIAHNLDTPLFNHERSYW